MKKIIPFVVVIGLWFVLSAQYQNTLLFPNPINTTKALLEIITNFNTLLALFFTLIRLLVAISIAALFGIVLGTIAGLFKNADSYIRPYIVVLRSTPVLSVIIFILIIFGYFFAPFIICSMMLIPIFYDNVYMSIKNIDQDLIDVCKLENDSLLTSLKECYYPLIKSDMQTAFLQSTGLGLKVLVMAEFLAQTQSSIGNAIYESRLNLQFDFVFAWTIILVAVIYVSEKFILKK